MMSNNNEVSSITELKHSKSNASCKIHAFGATVLSCINEKGQELLFVSRASKLDGSKAIRGGIPLVFPIFGPPSQPTSSTMPQHGFARNNFWKPVGEITDTEESASITYQLELKDVSDGRGTSNPWENNDLYNVKLELTVTITGESLSTTMTVQNTGTTDFDFQALFHTYYSVANHSALDPTQCYVKGLEGYTVFDKVAGKEFLLGSHPVTVTGELDSVHTPPSGKPSASVEIGVGDNRTVSLSCQGTVDGTVTPVSMVVWNPHEKNAANMGDFGNDQYVDMICVEPGILSRPVLPAGKVAELKQVIRF